MAAAAILGVGNQPVVRSIKLLEIGAGTHGSPQDDHRWRIAERRPAQMSPEPADANSQPPPETFGSRMTNSPFDARCRI